MPTVTHIIDTNLPIYATGNQTISGVKNFISRPTFSGLDLMTTGDLIDLELQILGLNNIVYTTGNQTISGTKIFDIRPNVNGTGVLLSGEASSIALPNTIVYTNNNQTISGTKKFIDKIEVDSIDFIRNFSATGTPYTHSLSSSSTLMIPGSTGLIYTGWNLALQNPSDDANSIKLSSGSPIQITWSGTGYQGIIQWFAVPNKNDLSIQVPFNLFNEGSRGLTNSLLINNLLGKNIDTAYGFIPSEYDRIVIKFIAGGGSASRVFVSGDFGINNTTKLESRNNRLFLGNSGILFQGEAVTSSDSKYIYINGPTSLKANTKVVVDTSASGFALQLPTSNLQSGDSIEVLDFNKTFGTNNLTIGGGGASQIESSSDPLLCNVNGANFILTYVGGSSPPGVIGWRINVLDNNFQTVGSENQKGVIPLLYLSIATTGELFDSPDSTNYKIPWNNIEWINYDYAATGIGIDTTKYITYNPVNKNIYVKETGIYNIDLRYGSFNMVDATDFLRARLRSSTSPIESGLSSNPPAPPSQGLLQPDVGGPDVFAAFAQGQIGTTQNGEAMCAGFTTFYITGSRYLVADFLHFGAFNVITSLPRGFPVYTNTFGNRPFLFLSKII